MENSYEIPNLENQKNDIVTCDKLFFTTLPLESL